MENIFKADANLLIAIQRIVDNSPILVKVWVFFAQYLIYGLPILLIVLWFWSPAMKKAVFKSVIAALFAWRICAKVIALIVDRPRPSEYMLDAKELVFHRPDTSFPSDHATMLFALAFSLRLYGFKKLGNILLIISSLIVISRVFVGVHFPLDIVAGAVLGLLVAWIVWSIREYIDRYITEPVIKFLKRFHL